MRNSNRGIAFIPSLGFWIVVGCTSSDIRNGNSSAEVAGTCSDPVNCPNSEPAIGGEVSVPARPEAWTAPPPAVPDLGEGIDVDQDGWDITPDCNDLDSSVHPTAYDVSCDGVDQNCDGVDRCDSDMDGFVDSVDCSPMDPAIKDECRPHSVEVPLK